MEHGSVSVYLLGDVAWILEEQGCIQAVALAEIAPRATNTLYIMVVTR